MPEENRGNHTPRGWSGRFVLRGAGLRPGHRDEAFPRRRFAIAGIIGGGGTRTHISLRAPVFKFESAQDLGWTQREKTARIGKEMRFRGSGASASLPPFPRRFGTVVAQSGGAWELEERATVPSQARRSHPQALDEVGGYLTGYSYLPGETSAIHASLSDSLTTQPTKPD
jgi:hypothetical protein